MTAFLARLLLLLFAWLSFAASAIPASTRGYDAQARHMDSGYDVPLLSAIDYDSAAVPIATSEVNPTVGASGIFGKITEFLAAEGTVAGASKLWTTSEFNGTRVYQRNDLIDTALVDARGRSNLERMQSGLAPIGPDGQSINLHHTIQTADSPLAEMTATFHQENSSIIHINPNTIPSGIDRSAFDAFRRDYWINRAKGFTP